MDTQIIDNTQKEVISSRPIAETLRAMEISDVEVFPGMQLNGVMTTVRRAKIVEKKVFSVSTKEGVVTVTRTA